MNEEKRRRGKGPDVNLPGENPMETPECVVSATECTGLSPAAVEDGAQADAYAQLYGIHKQRAAKKPRRP